MTHIDVYGRTHELDAQSLNAIAARLEARRSSDRYMLMLKDYLDVLDLSSVEDVLILGCGTGVEIRELLKRSDLKGRIVAVDISSELIERAKAAFRKEGIGADIEWRVEDAQALRLSDASYDLVLAHTLVSHVPDPEAVIKEAARLVRPGGTVAIFDGDYATMTYGTDDPAYGRLLDDKIINSVIANPRVMRSMPRMLRRAGLELKAYRGWVLTEVGKADFFLASLDSYPALLPKAGVLTAEEVEAFVADQRQAHEDGTFFAGYNFYAMIAQRPV